MTTIVQNVFSINGVISTDKTVMQNIDTLCTAAGAWMTYDIETGQWSPIINRPGTSVASFNDSNIIGGINVSGSGINELYNSVSIQFPHKDIRDETDYLELQIPSGDRFPNELDNQLNISIDCINDPVQAEYLAAIQLKQNRIDKIIEFRTDYSEMGLKAGDVIDVTAPMYGFSSKLFRVTNIEEADEEGIVISVTAIEYSSDVYSSAGLIRKLRERKTGIVPKAANTALTQIDNRAVGINLTDFLQDAAVPLLISNLLAALARNIGGGGGNMVGFDLFTFTVSTNDVESLWNAKQGNNHPFPSNGIPENPLFPGVEIGPWYLENTVKMMVLQIEVPLAEFEYDSSAGERTFRAYIPSSYGTIYRQNPEDEWDLVQLNTADWQTPLVTVQVPLAQPGYYALIANPLPTYDLNQPTTNRIMPYNYVVFPQANGEGMTLTGYLYYQ